MVTTQQLLTRVREKLNDIVEPFLFSDGKIYDALSRAQRDFVERTLCLQRVFELQLLEGISEYPLDEYTMKVRRISDENGYVIQPRTVSEMDLGFVTRDYGQMTVMNWRAMTGQPRYAVTDLVDRRLFFVPTPATDVKVSVEAYVYPEDLSETTEPEIPVRWVDELLAGALMNLFRLHDMELYDPREAEAWEKRWEVALFRAVGFVERDQRGSSAGRFNRNGVW